MAEFNQTLEFGARGHHASADSAFTERLIESIVLLQEMKASPPSG